MSIEYETAPVWTDLRRPIDDPASVEKITLRDVTMVAEVSDIAAKNWENGIWS